MEFVFHTAATDTPEKFGSSTWNQKLFNNFSQFTCSRTFYSWASSLFPCQLPCSASLSLTHWTQSAGNCISCWTPILYFNIKFLHKKLSNFEKQQIMDDSIRFISIVLVHIWDLKTAWICICVCRKIDVRYFSILFYFTKHVCGIVKKLVVARVKKNFIFGSSSFRISILYYRRILMFSESILHLSLMKKTQFLFEFSVCFINVSFVYIRSSWFNVFF